MPSFAPLLLRLRRDPRIFRLPPILSLLCIVVGVAWLLLLPLEEYSRKNYISENALLPGQVHAYFGGSEHLVFRAYRHEVSDMVAFPDWPDKIADIFQAQGFQAARQKFEYQAAGLPTAGENVYAMLKGPRADATEAMVLMAPMRNMDGQPNHSGVALALTMARYFKRWSLWSKDILFVITADSIAGPQAWVDAYHDQQPAGVDGLQIKGGALQGAVSLDYPAGPMGHRYDKLHVIYDGVNGQLPNLDLLNSFVNIMNEQVGIGAVVQGMTAHDNRYEHRLETLLRGIASQGVGEASGPHSPFMRYHVDAITLQTVGDGWHDEMALGRVVEGGFRSINNLLEKLHQSFFLYMQLEAKWFVSVGTYLPSAMLIAANFTITSIALWIQSGWPSDDSSDSAAANAPPQKEDAALAKRADKTKLVALDVTATAERSLTQPLFFITSMHFLGLIPLLLFNVMLHDILPFAFLFLSTLALLLPYGIAPSLHASPPQTQTLIQCFSLLILGISVATLSTVNFSLGLLTGLAAAPLSFVRPAGRPPGGTAAPEGPLLTHAKTAGMIAATTLVNPMALIVVAGVVSGGDAGVIEGLRSVLVRAAFAWRVSGTWTSVIVWLVWWPAWVSGASVAAARLWGPPAPVKTATRAPARART